MANIERRRFLQGAAALTVGSALVGATGQSAHAAPAPEALTGAPATRRLRFDSAGRKDFPEVGGNFGNQTTPRSAASTPATSATSAVPG
jgi:FtsP/CotA-like multicopper oxidase with cupredoxin domain